ncbi:cell division cycle protein 20 homolog [Ostrea edulis]|uniref:cell division cycle protein 20 homolog n=1 Tax=Ostrea edulis TaxID=37623 RepID=UPI0020948010|nr:cell division cycle protein 20 homolog [Ostrea edulis]
MAATELCSPKINTLDRFIPYRPNLDVNVAHARVMSPPSETKKHPSPWSNDRQRLYSDVLDGILDTPGQKRVLPITRCQSPETQNDLKLCSQRPRRRVITSPKNILDMPKIRNDFYTNVLDWGQSNRILVALEKTAYIWDVESKLCQKVDAVKDEEASSYFVSAVCWDNEGHLVATGDSQGHLKVFDPETEKTVRSVNGDGKTTVSVVKWRNNEIYTGDRKGGVFQYDVRCPTMAGRLVGHGQNVCGMALSDNSHDMVTGSNSGIVRLWDLRTHKCFRTIKAHSACAKALAWCPWRSSVIATGGGAQDGYIKLWQIHTGELISETSTKSQICGLLWSVEYQELASTHGSVTPENNDIVLWKMSRFQFEPLARLQQHLARPLHMALSPDGTTIASAGVDEIMCIWECFPGNREHHRKLSSSSLDLNQMIR